MKVNEILPECPFYDHEFRRGVKCEGLSEKSFIRLCFPKEEDFKEHRLSYCCSMNWEKCPIAKMLNAKYGC